MLHMSTIHAIFHLIARQQLLLGRSIPVIGALMLSACFGGTIAQQIASTALMQGADQATAAAFDTHARNEKLARQTMALPDNTELDDYQIAFLRSGFERVQPNIEPLPQHSTQNEAPVPGIQETKLVSVEVWSLLIGEEKQHLLEKARLKGSPMIPPKNEWSEWHLAIGEMEGKQQTVTFLIPPNMGKIYSGGKAMVELSSAGELSIARYAIN